MEPMTDGTRPPDGHVARTRLLVPAIVLLLIGGFLGWVLAYGVSEHSIYSVYGIGIVLTALLFVVAVPILIGIANLLRRERRGRPAARLAFGAAGLLLLGAGAGYLTVPVFDLGYHAPPLIEPSVKPAAEAAVILRLDDEGGSGVDPDWVATAGGGLGTCPFEDDGSVRFVIAAEAGRLRTSPMSVQVDLAHQPQVREVVLINLEVDTGASWWGQAVLTEITPGGMSGRALFMLRSLGEELPGWPPSVRGEVSWVCA